MALEKRQILLYFNLDADLKIKSWIDSNINALRILLGFVWPIPMAMPGNVALFLTKIWHSFLTSMLYWSSEMKDYHLKWSCIIWTNELLLFGVYTKSAIFFSKLKVIIFEGNLEVRNDELTKKLPHFQTSIFWSHQEMMIWRI